MTIAQQYSELLSMAQLYLLQEHSKEDWIFSERQNFNYFKETAQKQLPAKQEKPVVQKSAPSIVSTYSPPPPPKPIVQPTPLPPEAVKPVEKPKTPLVPAVEEKKPPTLLGQFVPEQMTKASAVDLTDIRQIVTEKFPQLAIIDEIPQLVKAQGVSEVLLIHSSEDTSHVDFLQKVAKAIKDKFCSAEVCTAGQLSDWEKLISSPHLKLVLMVGTDLENHPELKQYYRELPKHNRQLLGKVPFIPMAEISAYLADIKQKSVLWKSICEHLQT